MATHLLLFSPQLHPQSVCIYKCPTFQLLNSKSQLDHTSHFSHPLKDFSCHLCSNVTSSSVAPSSVFFFTVIYFLTASLLQLSNQILPISLHFSFLDSAVSSFSCQSIFPRFSPDLCNHFPSKSSGC